MWSLYKVKATRSKASNGTLRRIAYPVSGFVEDVWFWNWLSYVGGVQLGGTQGKSLILSTA